MWREASIGIKTLGVGILRQYVQHKTVNAPSRGNTLRLDHKSFSDPGTTHGFLDE